MEAADTCRRLITLRHNDAHAHVSLGRVLMMKLCDFQAAKTAFREAKRLKSDDWMVRDLIANAWSDWGDWDAAVEERREVVARDPLFDSSTTTWFLSPGCRPHRRGRRYVS